MGKNEEGSGVKVLEVRKVPSHRHMTSQLFVKNFHCLPLVNFVGLVLAWNNFCYDTLTHDAIDTVSEGIVWRVDGCWRWYELCNEGEKWVTYFLDMCCV